MSYLSFGVAALCGATFAPTVANAQADTFNTALFAAADPRVIYSAATGYYYSAFNGEGNNPVAMYRSQSLVDRGTPLYPPAGFPLMEPNYITSGAANIPGANAWFVFDINGVWVSTYFDPYLALELPQGDPAAWTKIQTPQWSGSTDSFTNFDFSVFQNPQPGPFQNHWYAARVADATGPFEEIYINEIINLSPGAQFLDNMALPANSIVNWYFDNPDWKDIIVESPTFYAAADNTVSMFYSGNGAQTSNYGIGVALLTPGQDPTLGTSWVDATGASGCLGDGPIFATTSTVYGPGVLRFAPSLDNTQTWALYRTKVWDTGASGANGNPPWNEQSAKQTQLQQVSFTQGTCNGISYTIPWPGTPANTYSQTALPSGDAGVTPAPAAGILIPAATMIPFGNDAMGSTLYNTNDPTGDYDPIDYVDGAAWGGYGVGQFDALAAGGVNPVTGESNQSGLTLPNVPGSTSINIHAASNGGSVTLYVFPAGGGSPTPTVVPLIDTGAYTGAYASNTATVDIPNGGMIQIVYTGSLFGIDFIQLYGSA